MFDFLLIAKNCKENSGNGTNTERSLTMSPGRIQHSKQYFTNHQDAKQPYFRFPSDVVTMPEKTHQTQPLDKEQTLRKQAYSNILKILQNKK